MSSQALHINPTLSVVITAHRERLLIVPTLKSAAAAAALSGVECELVVVLDNVDEQTEELVEEFSLSTVWTNVQIIRESLGDSGSARRSGVRSSEGKFVAIIDGDDLISANYFKVALETLELKPQAIVHPGIVLSFGARDLTWRVFPSDYQGMNYRLLLDHNPWPSSHIASKDTINAHPYSVLPPKDGFGPEDWVWNIHTSAEQVEHVPAPGTVFFYRVKALGGVNTQHSDSILPKLPIDALRKSLPAVDGKTLRQPAELEKPSQTSVQRFASGAKSLVRPVYNALTWWLNPRLLELIKSPIYRLYRYTLGIDPSKRRRLKSLDSVTKWIDLACEIEPALSNAMESVHDATIWQISEGLYSKVLSQTFFELRDYSAIVVVPWIGNGGADKVALNYVQALQKSELFRRKVAILTMHEPSKTNPLLIPEGVALFQLPTEIRGLHPDLLDRLVASIIIQVEPKLVLAVNGFDVVNAMKKFGKQMKAKTQIYATLFSWDLTKSGFPTNPITDAAERDHLNFLTGLITDNPVTAEAVHQRIGIKREKILTHLQPVIVGDFSNSTQPKQGAPARSSHEKFRVVWPHRIDREKRPDTLIQIAKRAKERNLPIQIEVWGSAVLSNHGNDPLAEFAKNGIKYCGPFSGGLFNIPGIEEYDALLLTSQNEGLPLVLVEAQLARLPIVASGVGGVPHIVRQMETGLLTEGPEDIDGFVDSLEALLKDSDLRTKLAEAGYAHASVAHSWPAFEAQVSEEILAKLSQIEAS